MEPEVHNYFYVKPEDVHREYFTLKDDEFHHAVHVLRLSPGAVVIAVDGEGNEMLGEVRDIHGKEARCTIVKTRRKPNELLLDITLIQALIKGDRFDYVVEKAVEFGVNTIIPVHTKRCIVSAHTQKIHRWRRIAVTAMKQSCRSVLPTVTDVMPFHEALEYAARGSGKILLHKDGHMTLSRYIDGFKPALLRRSIIVAVGPEGDFTPDEIDAACEQSFEHVSLGPRRLRSETAGLAAIAALSACEI